MNAPQMAKKMAQSAQSPDPAGASLGALQKLVKQDLARVNALILETVQSSVEPIPLVAQHLITAGGKRLRPMLTLAAAQLCGCQEAHRVIPLAASVEFIHAATLLHDDVIDNSTLRRGQATANATWGNHASVLVGDFLFVKSFQLMLQEGSPRVLDLLAQASQSIVEGEILQLTTQGDPQTSQEKHLDVVLRKTSSLFEAAMGIGALVAHSPETTVQTLMAFGRNLGICFQLVDDILDYTLNSTTAGKSQGDDFRDAKVTLPVILAYDQGNQEEQAFWKRVFRDHTQKEGDFQQALAYLHKRDTLAHTLNVARTYAADATAGLKTFPQSPMRDALEETVQFCLDRTL